MLQTLSHAPTWSRDVARLMNAEHEYDWRFLATRLGYSKDDIRSWATQPDPCLSLLDEWFATHKTREATFAVEKALNEMNAGERLCVMATDPGSMRDFEVFSRQSGHALLASEQEGDTYTYVLQKKA